MKTTSLLHPTRQVRLLTTVLILSILWLGPTINAGESVVLKPVKGGGQLEVDGKPFFIQGVTYGIKFDEKRLKEDFQRLQDLGANSIRTWGCGEPQTTAILDAAQEAGLKVMVGLWLRHGRPGAEGDDSFNYLTDEKGMEQQFKDTLEHVRRYKDHPAVLCWGVGNEVILNMATEEEKVAYAKFLERVCQAIKKEDPDHPIASVSAWTISWPYWHKYCPSIELYGINTYGYGAANVPAERKKLGIEAPYVITEFGASGEWEAQTDPNGVKVEPDDKHKHDIIVNGWKDFIAGNEPACVGGYVFNFGKSFDHTGLWLGFFAGDNYRPSYWGTRKAFTGKGPENAPPEIDAFLIRKANQPHKAGEWVEVMVKVRDPEKEKLDVKFVYNQRSGSREFRDNVHELKFRKGEKEGRYEVQMPDGVTGGIKVYALVTDPFPNLSAATASVRVEQ